MQRDYLIDRMKRMNSTVLGCSYYTVDKFTKVLDNL
jgi:hypothetical protein